jgi:hypothetical protein
MRVGIELGKTTSGEALQMDLEELLSTRLLVQGNSGSGKSHLLRRILEQSAGLVQQAIIDPEGDFGSFAERYGHVVVDASQSAGDLTRIAERIRKHRASVVLDLEGLDAEEQMLCAASFLGGLFDADRDSWFPMLIAVDEAQLFAPAVGGEVSDEARKSSLGAMTNLMCRGRKRGLAGIIATQRLAKLAKNVAAEASNFLMGRTFLDIDMARAADLLGMERRQADAFRDLVSGQFVALGPALTRRPTEVRIGGVETASRSGRPSLLPLPETGPEDLSDLIFSGAEDVLPVPERARKVHAPDLLQRIATQQPQLLMVDLSEPDERSETEKAAEVDAIFAEILADPEAAFRPVPLIYQEFAYQCRVKRLDDFGNDMPAFRRRLALARAGLESGIDDPDWARVLEVSESLPEEMQGAYLLIARAARDGAPCPDDGALARVYGSHSPSRGRWLLTFMAERGYIVADLDFRGYRSVRIAGVGWRTAASHPKGGVPVRPSRPARPSRLAK